MRLNQRQRIQDANANNTYISNVSDDTQSSIKQQSQSHSEGQEDLVWKLPDDANPHSLGLDVVFSRGYCHDYAHMVVKRYIRSHGVFTAAQVQYLNQLKDGFADSDSDIWSSNREDENRDASSRMGPFLALSSSAKDQVRALIKSMEVPSSDFALLAARVRETEKWWDSILGLLWTATKLTLMKVVVGCNG